jgi:hypothetical protein
VFIHHTVTRASSDPVLDARAVEAVGRRRFGRLSYGVLVHPRSAILWGAPDRVGCHTEGHNSTAVGLALIGNYEDDPVTEELVYAACVALHALRTFGIVTKTPTIRPHREVKSTACPGRHAVADLLPWLRLVAADPSWRP